MVEVDGVAPALSSYQDEHAFAFDRYSTEEKRRDYLPLKNINTPQDLRDAISAYYSVRETISFLNTEGLGYRRVTLQFPDNLVCDAGIVAQMIQEELIDPEASLETEISCNNNKMECSCNKTSDTSSRRSVWVLADTSYSSCCVDEVAAEHVSSDLVIHYGDACLNPVKKVSVAYVFGSPVCDIERVAQSVEERYKNEPDAKIVLMTDSPHAHILEQLQARLDKFPKIIFADLSSQAFPEAKIIGHVPHNNPSSPHYLNRCFNGMEPSDDIASVLAEYNLFHVTVPEAPRLLQLTTLFQSVTVYDQKAHRTSQGPFPNLRRRYRYMHEARAAGTIGILVNTLSIANTKTVIEGLKKRIKQADRKHYVFVVGKPNVAKLANFEEIDIWCILGCDHQGIILDNDYYKPIVTPFELLGALADEVTWTNKFETNFSKIESMLAELNLDDDLTEKTADSEDLPPQFNVVTGAFASNSRPLREMAYLKSSEPAVSADSSALVQKLSSEVAIGATVSTAAIFLQNRSWRGLGSDFDEARSHEGSAVEEGIDGVARGYSYNDSK